MVATMMANIDFCLILLTPLLVIISMFGQIKLCIIHKALYWGWNGARQWVSTCSTLHGRHGAAGEPLASEILKHLRCTMMNRGDNGVQKTWNQFFTRLGVPTSGGGEVRGQIFRWHCNNWPATLHFLKIPQTRMLNYQTILIFFPSTFCSPNEWLNSPSKTQKLMKNRLTVLSGFQVKLDGKSLATGTVDHQGRF